MLSVLILLVVLCIGAFTMRVFMNRGFGETVALSCIGVVAILFLFGFLGRLKLGTIFILLGSFILFVFDMVYLSRKKSLTQTVKAFFTDSSFYIYLVVTAVVLYITYGHMAYAYDDFTHWANVVKTMSKLDDFITNAASQSHFIDYPPGMPLFQVFLQKINEILSSDVYTEWMIFTAYYMFATAVLMPIFSKLQKKAGWLSKGLLLVSLLVCPFFVIETAYRYVYIEMIFTALIAAGFFEMLVEEKKDAYYYASICSFEFMLALIKGPGMMFATFMAVTAVLGSLLQKDVKIRNRMVQSIPFILSAAVPKILWSLEVAHHHVEASFNKSPLIPSLMGRVAPYKQEVVVRYFKALCTKTYPLGNSGIEINYIVLFMLLMAAILWVMRKNFVGKKHILATFFSMCAAYMVGTVTVYVCLFTESEAETLSYMERYMEVIFQPMVYLLVMLLGVHIVEKKEQQNVRMLFLCTAVLFAVRLDFASGVLLRNHVHTAKELRATYQELIESREWDAEDEVVIVTNRIEEIEQMMVAYCVKPARVTLVDTVDYAQNKDAFEDAFVFIVPVEEIENTEEITE